MTFCRQCLSADKGVKILRPSQLMAEPAGPDPEEGGSALTPEGAGDSVVVVGDKENRSPGRARKRMDPGRDSEDGILLDPPFSVSGSRVWGTWIWLLTY